MTCSNRKRKEKKCADRQKRKTENVPLPEQQRKEEDGYAKKERKGHKKIENDQENKKKGYFRTFLSFDINKSDRHGLR